MDRLPWLLLLLLACAGCTPEKPLVCRSARFASGLVATWPDTLPLTPLPAGTPTESLRADPALFDGKGTVPLGAMLWHRPLAMHYRICQNTTRDTQTITQCMTRVPGTDLLLVADFPRVPAFEQDSLYARTERAAKSTGEEMQRCRETANAATQRKQ